MNALDHARAWDLAAENMLKRFRDIRNDNHLQRPMLAGVALCRAISHGYQELHDAEAKLRSKNPEG